MEIYGDMLTIMQSFYHRNQSDRGLDTQIAFVAEVLRKGDIFSGCGQAQCHMLVGNWQWWGGSTGAPLAMSLRAGVILPGSPAPAAAAGADASEPGATRRPPRRFLTQHGITDDDFVVLWCGGYNTWTDVETLFQGLEAAMQANARAALRLARRQHRFRPRQCVRPLVPTDCRFALCRPLPPVGWLPWSEMADFYRE